MEKGSEGSTGTGVRAKVKGADGKHLKLYMNPPSIPTRYQTIHFDDSERKGFSSTSKRFYKLGNELPGPGYYAQAAEAESLWKEVSTSRKGYGIGFASESRRFANVTVGSAPVSPTKYDPTKAPVYSKSQQHSLSPAFRLPVAYKVDTHKDVLPGPCSYNPHVRGASKKWQSVEEAGASFVFKSRTGRSSLSTGSTSLFAKSQPPPGAYNVSDSIKATERSVAAATAAFKAPLRKTLTDVKLDTPAPTAYNVIQDSNQHDTVKSHRPRIKRISRTVNRPHTPTSTQVAIPGSGATPVAFPTPGRYDIAKGSNFVLKTVPPLRSIFMSKSKRFDDPAGKNNPAPGKKRFEVYPFNQNTKTTS